jgi:RING finger protein 113A
MGGAEKGSVMHVPLRASLHIRTSIRIDYAPDICKDYKETGYCGFGDSCKFMHDRGDYKMGWQIDRDYEAQEKKKREMIAQGWDPEAEAEGAEGEEESEDDDLPFACSLCRELWDDKTTPIKTRCGHYFHEQCALKQNTRTGKCAVCEKPTQGIFNVASEIQRKMKRKRERDAEKFP